MNEKIVGSVYTVVFAGMATFVISEHGPAGLSAIYGCGAVIMGTLTLLPERALLWIERVLFRDGR